MIPCLLQYANVIQGVQKAVVMLGKACPPPLHLFMAFLSLLKLSTPHFVWQLHKSKCTNAVENQTQEVSTVTLHYQNVTYTIILKNLTWFEAQEECLQNNMQLVSITKQYQQAFLAAQVAQHNYQLWIGLSNKDDRNNYQWSDGKHVQFSRWSNDDGVLVDDCVYLDSDGFWKTSECYSKMPGAICYIPGDQNASLLSIKDEKENDFVVEQLHSFGGFAQWLRLGLMYEPADNLLKWYDETQLTYNNWRLGRPSVKTNNIIAGVNLDGFWDIDTQGYSRYSHIDRHRSILACKIEMVPKEDKSPLPKVLYYGNYSYWILQEKLSWYKAWGECKQNGGDLASIHDESQQVFLEDIVKRDGFPLWFGLSSHNGSESDFQWSDGSTFDYKPWEYEHSHSSGNCFYLDTQGLWNRLKCTDNVDGAICYSPLKNSSATVLTIKDAEENSFVITHLKEHSFITGRVWLGLYTHAKSSNWLDDGSEVKYTNWAKGKASGECSIIFSTNGTWSQIDCLKDQSRVVCKAPQVSNHTGGAIAVAVFIIFAFLAGLIYFLYKKKRLQWGGFSSVRYERGMHDDETDSMFTRDGD
ncbi:hypothetical protein lerEdw1_017452 [Lerista edwardsae]|nr:hypothetical protein lerEdw1_017452 [Lerista edwardsae]